MRPRLVATDLDGTLVRSDGTVSDATIDVLHRLRANGTELVAVTGRPPRWVIGHIDHIVPEGLVICANGALVVDITSGEIVANYPIERDVAQQVAAALRAVVPDIAFAVERGHGFAHEPAYSPRWPTPDSTLVVHLEELLAEPMAKLLARHGATPPDELLDLARGAVESLATVTHSSSDGLVEISAAGVTKATTLARLCDERGIRASEVVAFGDMPNDLPMLEWAGTGVAVANAHAEVLAAADDIAASNDEDGVASWLIAHLDL